MKKFRKGLNKFLSKFGYKISKSNSTEELIKIYKYKNYDEYKKIYNDPDLNKTKLLDENEFYIDIQV